MADTDKAINYLLVNDFSINNLNGDRVSPQVRPPNTGINSSIVYTIITETDEPNVAREPQLKVNRYQIACYSNTRAHAKEIASAVKDALHQFDGTISSEVEDHDSIVLIEYVTNTRREDFEEEMQLYVIYREYDVFFN